MVGEAGSRRGVGQNKHGEASFHGLAAARRFDGPRGIVQLARRANGRIPDIDIQPQGVFHLPLADGAETDLIACGMARIGSGKDSCRKGKGT